MEQVEAPRIRPGVRGSFDEETCRMRLDRLGIEHVPRYPFEYGIQQIYAILLGEYGRSQIADVISVLHELLEDESIEGYIWRSWRHEWRHRNDDILNPFVPAVGDFVLPPPTSKCIRALKAANFSAAEGQILPSSRSSVIDHDEELPSYISSQSLAQSPAQSPDHERSFDTGSVVNHEIVQETRQHENKQSKSDSQQLMRPTTQEDPNDQPVHNENDILSAKANEDDEDLPQLSPLKSDEVEQPSHQSNSVVQAEQVGHNLDDGDGGPDKDSQQEFASVTNSDGHHDDPNLLNFEMLGMQPSLSSQHRQTHSEPTDTLVLRPVHSGGPSSDIGRDVEIPHRHWSEYLDPGNDHEAEPVEQPANSTPGAQQADATLDQDEPATCSAVLHMPFTTPTSDAEFNEEHLDQSEADPAPSAGHQEKSDDDVQQLLPDAAYLDEAVRMPVSTVKSYTAEKTTASIDTASDHASLHSWRGDKSDAIESNHGEISVINGEVLSHAPQQSVSPTAGRFPIDSPGEEEISQIRSHKCEPHDHRDGVRCSRISAERYPIDGHESSHGNRRASMLLSRKETQPSQLLRQGRSLLQHMPKIFRKGRESKQTNPQDPDPIEDGSSTTPSLFRRRSTKTGLRSKIGIGSRPKVGPDRTTPIFSFDGACDEDDSMSTMPAVDLNKALPPQPLLTKSETPATCGTNTPSLAHSSESKTRPSTASTLSSELSRVSSKKRFHRTTHDLIHPDMAGSREPSPLHELDADRLLVASKYDPLASPKQPDTRPLTFSSFNNANPFMDQYDEFIPPMPVPAVPELRLPDPVKSSRVYGIPQSRSDGQIYSPKTLQVEHTRSKYQLGQSDGTDEHSTTTPRGRVPSRDVPQPIATLPSADEKSASRRAESRKRSRSPVKRFLGLGKSQSMKDIPQDKEANDESDKKAGLRLWGDRLRHGFLVSISLPTIPSKLMNFWTNTEPKANTNTAQPEVGRSRAPSQSTFPISITPTRQAKIQCEVELMICVTANKFLKFQQKAGLMSPESVTKVVSQWKQKNRPQVLEFQFDQATQRDLVLYNINTFKFYGEAQTNPMVLNATMYAWKVMAKEMSVRTFCTPDSVIRKHLHDTHKVLEMLGAGLPTFLALQELQVATLKEMAEKQKEKVERQRRREKEKEAGGSGTMAGSGMGSAKTRKFTPPTPATSSFTWTPMGAFLDEETLLESQFEG